MGALMPAILVGAGAALALAGLIAVNHRKSKADTSTAEERDPSYMESLGNRELEIRRRMERIDDMRRHSRGSVREIDLRVMRQDLDWDLEDVEEKFSKRMKN